MGETPPPADAEADRSRQGPAALELTPIFQAIFENSLDAIAVLRDGIHVLVNAAYVRLYGYDSADQLIGRPVIELIASAERPRIIDTIRRRAAGEAVASAYVSRGQRRDGTGFDLEVRGSTFRLSGQVFVLATVRDVTEQVEATESLRDAQGWFRALFESSPDPAWIIENHRFIDCNAAAVQMLGYADKSRLLFLHPSEISPPFQPCGEATHSKAERMILLAEEQGINRFEWMHRRADGADFPAEVTLSSMTLQGRKVLYCVWRDITGRKAVERALRDSEQRFRDFTFASADWIWECDYDGRFTYVGGNVEAVLGYTPAEMVGRMPFEFMPPEEAARVSAILQEVARRRDAFSDLRNINVHKNGSLQYASTSGIPVFDADGNMVGYRGIDRDVTALQERDDKILKLAYHDALTGLPNRILLEDRVTQALLVARRSGARIALLFLDLDRFKVVNDSLGHDVGDELLTIMGRRMQAVLRRSDTLSRLGGDEFVVVLTDAEGGEEVIRVAEKIIAEISRPVVLQGHEFTLGVSIGASIAPDDGDSFHALLKNADTAMYRAKEDGKSTLRFFDSSMNARIMGHLHLEGCLRKAIDNGDLEVHYQPKFRLPGDVLCGAEALARWQLDGEMVPPARFIPLAEDTGLIAALGDLVLAKALADIGTWRAAGAEVPRIAINLSARQFGDTNLVSRILRTVSDHGLRPSDLEIELTESLLMADLDRAAENLGRLHAEGFSIALDDFGTGYSSLGYLKRLPIQCVKIDRSFVRDIGTDRRDEALVDTILAIGRSLGLEVVAEGVETHQQLRFLLDRKCELFQGYLFSMPIPAGEFQARFLGGEATK